MNQESCSKLKLVVAGMLEEKLNFDLEPRYAAMIPYNHIY